MSHRRSNRFLEIRGAFLIFPGIFKDYEDKIIFLALDVKNNLKIFTRDMIFRKTISYGIVFDTDIVIDNQYVRVATDDLMNKDCLRELLEKPNKGCVDLTPENSVDSKLLKEFIEGNCSDKKRSSETFKI